MMYVIIYIYMMFISDTAIHIDRNHIYIFNISIIKYIIVNNNDITIYKNII